MKTKKESVYWMGYSAGAQDARSRQNSGTGPDAPWGNIYYDLGYKDGWSAEKNRLSAETDVVIHFKEVSDAVWWRSMLQAALDYGGGMIPARSEMGFGPQPFAFEPHPEAKIEH